MLGNHTTQLHMSTNTPTSLTLTTQKLHNPIQQTMLGNPHLNPTPYTPPRDHPYSDPTAYDTLLTALSRYLPSNIVDDGVDTDGDEFRMYEFKVRGCTRPKAHDWTECPFAHPGEKARRRDPKRYSYSGTACTDFRKGGCRRGDSCDFAHGVFECWLHPTRYRTQACKDGAGCARRVCFFAHSPSQLRVVSGLPSPVSIRSGSPDPFEESPPLTPVGRAYGHVAVADLAKTLRSMQLISKVGSPRFGPSVERAVRTGFYSLPTTPTGGVRRTGFLDGWEEDSVRETPIWESRLDMKEPVDANTGGSGPDFGWVSELIK